MKNFNASRWALDHKSLVVYFMLIIALVGMLQYHKLGREEAGPRPRATSEIRCQGQKAPDHCRKLQNARLF